MFKKKLQINSRSHYATQPAWISSFSHRFIADKSETTNVQQSVRLRSVVIVDSGLLLTATDRRSKPLYLTVTSHRKISFAKSRKYANRYAAD